MIENEDEAKKFVANCCDDAAMARLERFAALLVEENSRQNLISAATIPHLWQRHIADSAQLARLVPRETIKRPSSIWIDLGTGAGLPGLVIAAMYLELRVILVESRARRIEFLSRCKDLLGLANCTIIGERLERIDPFSVSVISARAFAPLDKLLRLSAPFSTNDTIYLLPKGRSAQHEVDQLPKKKREMFHVEQSLTDAEAGIIVSAHKS